jgi:hypothetical protein
MCQCCSGLLSSVWNNLDYRIDISLSPNTRAKRWENVTLDKIKVLVASLINMNLIKVQQLHLAGTQLNHIILPDFMYF